MHAHGLRDGDETRPARLEEHEALERLRRVHSESLEHVAHRLQQSDLVMLARFAAAPQPLVHHALAVLHTVLLSMSLLHESTTSLRVTPWALLRLDVLANAEAMWRKMGKRLARLRLPRHDPRRKPLASAQVRFVVEYVLMAPLLATCETCHELLAAVGRVSAIAESIIAYVLLCVHYSLVPPQQAGKTSPSKLLPTASPPPPPRMVHSPPKRHSHVEPLARTHDPLPPTVAKPHRSWRCGVKHGGRYFLFRALIFEDGFPATNGAGSISAYAIDCQHTALRWNEAVSVADNPNYYNNRRGDPHNPYARPWVKLAQVPLTTVSWIAEWHRKALSLDHAATLSLLLQTAVASEVFAHPPRIGRVPMPPTMMTTVSDAKCRFAMHTIILAARVDSITCDKKLALVAIGEIQVSGVEPTLADVRRQIVASCSSLSRIYQQLASASFRFFLHGALVPSDEESWRRAVELLPVAVLCLDDLLPHRRRAATSKHWRPWLTTLSTISRGLSSTLSRHLWPQVVVDPASSAARVAVSVYDLDQPVALLPSSPSSSYALLSPTASVASTVKTLLTLFVDWHAFVQFQQLQDTSAILYEYGSPEKPKRSIVAPPAWIDSCSAEERLRPEPTATELELLTLPHQPFCADTEFLQPLYVTFTFRSRRQAHLRCPHLPDAMSVLSTASEASPLRIAVENAECVVHIHQIVQNLESDDESPGGRLVIRFARDRSSPLEMLMTMRDDFVWVIQKLPSRASHVAALDCPPEPAKPPRWLRDVLCFVSHPIWDFQSPRKSTAAHWSFPNRYFRVAVPYFYLERAVERALWSRGIDWTPHQCACDVERNLLRPKYEAMRLAYPSSISIDSVKFSKFLRECGLQPQFLSVGDAAFLFTNHRAPGSHYEMDYEGFLDALKWIARCVPPTRNVHDETQQLREFCLEWLIRAPSMAEIWRRVVDRWRLIEKVRSMERAAIEYCAATRIQANWKRLVVRRELMATLTRLRLERRAAAKLQSLYKMRKVRAYFVQLKDSVLQTQRFVRARRLLRHLRLERAQLVEKMRLRLQKWVRQRLRVLRCWKAINAAWLARRARIQEKRSHLVWAAAYQIESRLYRVSLYRMPQVCEPPAHTGVSSTAVEFELEILDPFTSWFRSIRVTEDTLDVLEHDTQNVLGATKPAHARQRNRWKLLTLAQRLHLKRHRTLDLSRSRRRDPREPLHRWSDCIVQIYRDPIDTSLGRLVYQGSVQECGFYDAQLSPKLRFVRLTLRSHDFTCVVYLPESSEKLRFTFTTSFVYRLFRVAGFDARTFQADADGEHSADEMVARSEVLDMLTIRDTKLVAIRFLLRYVTCHGTKPATHDMMPEALNERIREQEEREKRASQARRQRQLELVIFVQSAVRRLLAIRRVQSLAVRSYTKSLDPVHRALVYTHRRIHDVLTYHSKPLSLRDKDAPDPVDEWLLNADTSSPATRYFNPKRGAFSPFNNLLAALKIQKWFRGTMWTRGFSTWDFRHLSKALIFHNRIHAPKDLSDSLQLECITNYALQRHVIDHDYKTASVMYESALKIFPDHVPALVGLAVLLIFSCRYPVKQTWARGLQLLENARRVDPELSKSLTDIEEVCFRWAMYLHAKNAEAFGNYAAFLQCVRGELDKAELLYRRAIDLDPANERVTENYLRLQRERTPEGIYSGAGPSKVAAWRAQEVRRVAGGDWRELEDTGARSESASRFFQNIRTGLCTWSLPLEPDSENERTGSTTSS